MRRPAQRRQGLCKLMKTCALVLAMLFIDGVHERLTFVGGGCNPFQPLIGFDGRVPTRLKAEVRNASPQKRRILPPLSEAADPQNHVFLSLTDYDQKIDQLFEGDHDAVFIRGGVAIGKTTVAEHLPREFPEKYVNVPFTGFVTDWKMNTVGAVEEAIAMKIDRDGSEFKNARKLAKENNLTLVYDEAHTLFSSPELCPALFNSSTAYKPKVLLFSASGDASTASTLIVSTPGEITQKYMWTPPLNSTSELQEQLKEAGVRLDQKSIKFFIQFCGGHRGIFIAAMRWVQSKQRSGISRWVFPQTVGFVRNSYDGGDWDCADTEILGYLRESRAVRVGGLYKDVSNVPREFAELLCKGSTTLPPHVRRDLTIHGFVVPKCSGKEGEFRRLDWMTEGTEYRAANPLLASYYFHHLEEEAEFASLLWAQQTPTLCRPIDASIALPALLPGCELRSKHIRVGEGRSSEWGAVQRGDLHHLERYDVSARFHKAISEGWRKSRHCTGNWWGEFRSGGRETQWKHHQAHSALQ